MITRLKCPGNIRMHLQDSYFPICQEVLMNWRRWSYQLKSISVSTDNDTNNSVRNQVMAQNNKSLTWIFTRCDNTKILMWLVIFEQLSEDNGLCNALCQTHQVVKSRTNQQRTKTFSGFQDPYIFLL